jgi:hypothetical protein
MKKALIAAAVAGAFVAPTAMAAEGPSVNIYYPMAVVFGDTETGNAGASTASETIADGGGARLMFNWLDSLNNGMTLGAYMSLNTSGATEAGGITSRNSNINLSGEFGTLAIGTNEHFFEIDAITDGYGADWALNGAAAGGEGLNFQRIGRTGFNFTRRDTNSVWWTGPSMNNLQLRAAYIFGPDATANDATDPQGYQIGFTYSMGGLSMKAAHASYDDYAADGSAPGAASIALDTNSANIAGTPRGATFNTVQATAANVAGSNAEGTQFVFGYDFGTFTASMGLINMDQQVGGDTFETSGFFASFMMPVSTGRILLNFGELSDQDINGQALQNSGIQGMDIGYQHDLSANTYTFVRYQTLDTDANFDDNGATNTTVAGTRGNARDTTGDVSSESSSFMFGIVFNY